MTTIKAIVLTGASGYLGQHCLRGLMEQHNCRPYNNNNNDDDEDNDGTSTIKLTSLVIYALVNRSSEEFATAISSYYSDANTTNDHDDDDAATNIQTPHHNQKNEHVKVITVALDLTSQTACQEWFESLQSPPPNNLDSDDINNNNSNNTSGRTTTNACFIPHTKINYCIHTAALSSPALCEQQPEYAMSINVPKHFFQQLFHHNPTVTVIAISTDQVYDGNITGSKHYNELSNCEPCNIYGTTKVVLETFLQQQQKELYNNASIVLLRSSIMLGPLAPYLPKRAHSTFLHFCNSRRNTSTTYYTDEIRSVIAVSDVVHTILYLISTTTTTTTTTTTMSVGTSEIYCMGGPTPVNRYEMAKAVMTYFATVGSNDDNDDEADTMVVPVLKRPQQQQVQSPLNISMDSSKLLQRLFSRMSSSSSTVATTSNNNDTIKKHYLSLSEIVQHTFGPGVEK